MKHSHVESADFRLGMRQMPSGVAIVTTCDQSNWIGITASSTASVSDDPPLLSVGVNKQSWLSSALMRSRIFCVSVLGVDHLGVAEAFARAPRNERFAAGSWTTMATGAPALIGALAVFDCDLFSTLEVKTHHVVLGRIVAVSIKNNGSPLVYRNGGYFTVCSV
jgi:flavin reductase